MKVNTILVRQRCHANYTFALLFVSRETSNSLSLLHTQVGTATSHKFAWDDSNMPTSLLTDGVNTPNL